MFWPSFIQNAKTLNYDFHNMASSYLTTQSSETRLAFDLNEAGPVVAVSTKCDL